MLNSLLYRLFPTIIVGINVSMADREIKNIKSGINGDKTFKTMFGEKKLLLFSY